MSLITIEGIYRNGHVELAERPQGVRQARVVVTFLRDDAAGDRAIRHEAGRRLLEDMKQGLSFGGVRFDRQELDDERIRALDERRAAGTVRRRTSRQSTSDSPTGGRHWR